MNGKIVYKHRVRAIKCDCSKCVWAKNTKYGDIFCHYFKRNNPQREKCKRYATKESLQDKEIIKNMESAPRTNGNVMAKDITSYEPAFPWERKIGGDKNGACIVGRK